MTVSPCLAAAWRRVGITYRRGPTVYRIHIDNPHGLERGRPKFRLDGREVSQPEVILADDGGRHDLAVLIEPTADCGDRKC